MGGSYSCGDIDDVESDSIDESSDSEVPTIKHIDYDKNKYWVGPFCVLVSNDIYCVMSCDGKNTIDKDGKKTKMRANSNLRMDVNTYRKKYAILQNGIYYHKDNFKKDDSCSESSSVEFTEIEKEKYWIGPYRVLVPNSIESVPMGDGRNFYYKNGKKTNHRIKISNLLNKKEYRKKYAIFKNGKYYYNINNHSESSSNSTTHSSDSESSIVEYNEDDKQNYWVGPHGVLVSKSIHSVPIGDGSNSIYDDGSVTKVKQDVLNILNKNAYRKKYAIKKHGKYYYNKNSTNDNKIKPDKKKYWIGPYKMLVSNDILSVPAIDGHNYVYKSGNVTNAKTDNKPMDKIEYRKKYAVFKNGKYYYKQNQYKIKNDKFPIKKGYWIGPYGIMVNDIIDSVIAADGFNIRMKNGIQTNKNACDHPQSKVKMTESMYKLKYTTIGDDGKYYYDKNKNEI